MNLGILEHTFLKNPLNLLQKQIVIFSRHSFVKYGTQASILIFKKYISKYRVLLKQLAI